MNLAVKEGSVSAGNEFDEMKFVSNLLMLTLGKSSASINIAPREFAYGAGGMIKTTGVLKVQITAGDVVVADDKVEISLVGAVVNDYGHNEKFTLYLSIWTQSVIEHLLKEGVKKAVETRFLEMECENLSVYLPDSVFGLDLFMNDDLDQQVAVGQGRGYLVFGAIV